MRIVNRTKFFRSVTVLIIIILILFSILIFKILNSKKIKSANAENIKNNLNYAKVEENEEDTESEENKIDEKIDLNNLSDDQASFGKINVPTYKIKEKELKIPILIYHAFQTPVPDNDVYKLFSTEARFEDNVKTLLEDGYTFITLEDLYKYKNGSIGLPEKNIAITMDDGWLGCYTEAFNVLKKYNVPATIFIVEDLVGTDNYFSWEQAKEMYDTGLVKIHIHGRKHIDYSKVKRETLVSDYNHTQKKIEEVLGNKVQKIMAYPAGSSSTNSIKWLKEAGFEIQVQTKYGTINKSSTLDLTNLGRIRAEQVSGNKILNTIKNHK